MRGSDRGAPAADIPGVLCNTCGSVGTPDGQGPMTCSMVHGHEGDHQAYWGTRLWSWPRTEFLAPWGVSMV